MDIYNKAIQKAMLGLEDTCFSLSIECAVSNKKKKEIFQILDAAIIRKEAWAYFVYGLYYENRPTHRALNLRKSLEYYVHAAKLGHPVAMYKAGCYFDFTETNFRRAKFWYLKGCKLKDSACCYSVAEMYYDGKGARKNLKTAFKYYELAATYGHGEGMCQVGYMLFMGEGVKKDIDSAIAWYRLSAENKSDGAMYNLGLCYKNGDGVSKNKLLALAWFEEAYSCGNAKAKVKIKQLKAELKLTCT